MCITHFKTEDVYISKSGRKRLKSGAAPCQFVWNNWGKDRFDRTSTHLGVDVHGDLANPAHEVFVPDELNKVHHEMLNTRAHKIYLKNVDVSISKD